MSSSLSRGGSLDETPLTWSGHVSPDPASSLEWLNNSLPGRPLQMGKDSALVSVMRLKSLQCSVSQLFTFSLHMV